MSNETTLKNLTTGLQMELTAAHQYQLHAAVLDDWGIDKLADKMREEYEEETGHQDRFLERILFLGGEPELAFHSAPRRATSLREMFDMDMSDEAEALRFYTAAAKAAYEADDLGSYELFKQIAIEEEGHKDWLQTQLELIERIGEERYANKHISPASDADD